MNRIHQLLCSSGTWARRARNELVPWVVDGLDLGTDVLEIGPGYGPTTRALAARFPRVTALEFDPRLAARLSARLPQWRAEVTGTVEVVEGDGTAMPFPDAAYSGVVCFTMLHHVPSRQSQDRLFAEAFRVLRPGGTFAGSDSRVSARFRLLHLFDTMVVVDPDTLGGRLEAAGFTGVKVGKTASAFRFAARRPA